jgi:hypothetical protein
MFKCQVVPTHVVHHELFLDSSQIKKWKETSRTEWRIKFLRSIKDPPAQRTMQLVFDGFWKDRSESSTNVMAMAMAAILNNR